MYLNILAKNNMNSFTLSYE